MPLAIRHKLLATSYPYDSLRRLSTITQGSGGTARTATLTYNNKNELTNIQDPLLRNVGFLYDLAGRITTQVLPDTRQIGYAYDGNGNVTSITPPPGPAHTFAYTPVDLESNYTPPDAGFSPRNTQYAYNLDRQLTLVTRPDGQTIQLGYEPTGGRLSTLTLPGSQTLTYAYGATTGTLSTITAPGSTLSYTYDGSLLKSTTWAGTIAGSVSRNYDNNFRITSQSVNGGNTVSFGYDNDSLLTSAHMDHGVRSCNNTWRLLGCCDMARPLRLEFPGAIYHVTSRGNARQDIVADDGDRTQWLAMVARTVERYDWRVYAYCLMDNHYHLVIETPQPTLARGMRQLNGVYTQAYNRRHDRVGHLFQGRYKAILVEKEPHLLELCRYVVLNPVRAKLVPHPRRWAWSSYRATAGEVACPPFLMAEWLLAQFGTRVAPAQAHYRRFVAEGRGLPSPWEQVTGQVYLGSNEFIAQHQPDRVIAEVPRRQTQAQRPTLATLFPEGKRTAARLLTAYRRHGYRLAEIASHLGVHYATVSRWLKHAEERDV